MCRGKSGLKDRKVVGSETRVRPVESFGVDGEWERLRSPQGEHPRTAVCVCKPSLEPLLSREINLVGHQWYFENIQRRTE